LAVVAVLAIVPAIRWVVGKISGPTRQVAVAVKADKASVSASETATFHATVENASTTAVTWSLNPMDGSVTADGVYTAPASIPAQRLVQVTATSLQDSTKSGNVSITLLPEVISLDPPTVNMGPSDSVTFTATLRPDAGPGVNWSLNPIVGTIDSHGVYNAPAFIPSPQTVILTASSEQKPQYSAKATILLSSTQLHIDPNVSNLVSSRTLRFTLHPNPGADVHWQVHRAPGGNPADDIGSISAIGVYKAPELVSEARKVIVTATVAGVQDPVNATIHLVPVTIDSISCTQSPNHQYACLAQVKNGNNPAVFWSISQGSGTISPQGVYSPPEISSPLNILVTATLAGAPMVTRSYSLTVLPMVTVRIDGPNPLYLREDQNVQLSATVTGSNNKGVTWTAVPTGSIFNGRYFPPKSADIPPTGIHVTIRATSEADRDRSATSEIILVKAEPVPRPGDKIHISSGIMAARLLYSSQPKYPGDAKRERVQGTVVLQATISATGTVESSTVVSGPPLLQQAALKAVRSWRYKPYLLNGKPVEVETQINVVFSLGG